MSIFYSLFFTFLLFIFSFKLNAQQEKNNTKFKIHKVEKGQSLYAIAKLYQIELSAIVMENPDAIDGIKAGQELKIPIANPKKETEKKEDKKLNTDGIHKVVKGETIYSICKKYNLSQPQLISLNPSLKEFGLKEGQLLQIKLITPEKSQTVQETKVETKVSKTELLENKIRPEIYQVKEEDDLATILSSSSMTETEFYNLNPEARQGIKKNQLIKIIRKKENETDNKNKIETALIENETEINPTIIIDTTTFIKKNNYTIGLMLPFKFNETDALDLRKMEEEKQNFPEQQSLAIDFYEGINYALHQIDSNSSQFKVEIFDISEKDSLRLESIIKEKRFQNLDICIGPVYNSMFKQVAEKSKSLKVPIVAPFTQQNKILFENQHASKINPSSITLIESMAELIVDSMEKGKIIIVNSGKSKEQNLIKAFKAKYNSYLIKKNKPVSDTAIEVKSSEIEKLPSDNNKVNYFIVISEDELYLSDLLTRLSRMKFSKDKNNNVIGLKKWIELENIDSDYLNRFNFIYPTSSYIDLSKNELVKATQYYQNIYNTDPSDYFFIGIDLCNFYSNILKKYGKGFYEYLNAEKKSGLIMDFNFFSPSLKTGFENKSIRLIQYKDYQFSKIH
jgi:LysM repeat protein